MYMPQLVAILEANPAYYAAWPNDAAVQCTVPYERAAVYDFYNDAVQSVTPAIQVVGDLAVGNFAAIKNLRPEHDIALQSADDYRLQGVEKHLSRKTKHYSSLLLMPSMVGRDLYGTKNAVDPDFAEAFGTIALDTRRPEHPGLVITMPRKPIPQLGQLVIYRS